MRKKAALYEAKNSQGRKAANKDTDADGLVELADGGYASPPLIASAGSVTCETKSPALNEQRGREVEAPEEREICWEILSLTRGIAEGYGNLVGLLSHTGNSLKVTAHVSVVRPVSRTVFL